MEPRRPLAPTRTQIVATIGPASSGEGVIRRMIEAGLDVARINFSHGERAANLALAETVRRIAADLGRVVPIMQDLAGPRRQTGAAHSFDSSLGALTEKDLLDLEAGCALGVELVAQSFVGGADDLRALRAAAAERGGRPRLVAKIERAEALGQLGEIAAAADAVMMARGDLGEAVPPEEIPFLERQIVAAARAAGKPAIVATQMLYSMVDSPEPTRAEVTDVAYAVALGADAVMLSDETARGRYPVEAVAAMERILSRAERESSTTVRPLGESAGGRGASPGFGADGR